MKQGNVDFFVTGHSLGGSVSNLLCAAFLNIFRQYGNKVFGYCFAPPKTIRFCNGWKIDGCDNIWNIVIEEDYYPTRLFEWTEVDWTLSWSRYGNDRYIPYTGNLDAHHSYSYIEGLLTEMKQ